MNHALKLYIVISLTVESNLGINVIGDLLNYHLWNIVIIKCYHEFHIHFKWYPTFPVKWLKNYLYALHMWGTCDF